MAIARVYVMKAADGQEQVMRGALDQLAAFVRGCAGSEGVELLADRERPGRFIFIEKWACAEDQRAAGAALPKDALAAIMRAADGGPDASTCDILTA